MRDAGRPDMAGPLTTARDSTPLDVAELVPFASTPTRIGGRPHGSCGMLGLSGGPVAMVVASSVLPLASLSLAGYAVIAGRAILGWRLDDGSHRNSVGHKPGGAGLAH
jgi:hypothetical protein